MTGLLLKQAAEAETEASAMTQQQTDVLERELHVRRGPRRSSLSSPIGQDDALMVWM
jgi:hypothetical protein